MVRVLADDRAQPRPVEQVVLALAQVQRDLGAAVGLLRHFDGELAAAVRLPAHALVRLLARAAGEHRHLVGDDERRVEADAELADQVRVLLLVAGQLREELARAGLGDRAEVGDHLVAAHADAVVRDAQRSRRRVVVDADLQLEIALEQRFVVQRLEAQLVAGVGGVGDQLPQEDLAVRVQRVDHQLQQLSDLGLEAQGLAVGARGGRFSHGITPVISIRKQNSLW